MINLLRQKIKRDSADIPYFLDTKKSEDHCVYNIITGSIFSAFYVLCSNKIYSYMDIESLSVDLFMSIGEIKSYSNDDTYIKVYKLVLKRLKDYEKFSCEYELYEASSNYKRLYDIVSGKKNNGVNGKI